MRIVSLYPAATEIVCGLGLQSSLVAISHECDYPPEIKSLPRITRCLIPPEASSGEIDRIVSQRISQQLPLYEVDRELLRELKPDFVITQSLCRVCAINESDIVQALDSAYPTHIKALSATTLAEVLESIETLGVLFERTTKAEEMRDALNRRVSQVQSALASSRNNPRVVMLEWLDPIFSAGHWSPELIRLAGGEEVLGEAGQLSRKIDWQDVCHAKPDVLLVACCGYGIERTRLDMDHLVSKVGFADLPAVKAGRVFLGDGNAFFNRPGPRLVDTLEMVAECLHPELFPGGQAQGKLERWLG
jgi:iron complex transport system substrate-binding protein